MSNAFVYGPIADALAAALTTAFVPGVFEAITIQEDTEPQSIQALPFINLRPLEIKSGMGPNSGVIVVNDTYRFEIILHFAAPTALGTVAGLETRIKWGYFDLIRANIQVGDGIIGPTNLCYVTGCDFKNRSPIRDGGRTIRVVWECQAQSNYYPS